MEQNICKFISDGIRSELKTVNFILERDPKAQAQLLSLPAYRMYLISRGDGTLFFDGQEEAASVGDLIFSFPSEAARGAGRDFEYFYISFTGQRAEELFRRFGITPATRRFSGHEGLLPFWRENIARATEENLDIISESVLMYSFSLLNRVHEPREDVISRLLRHTEEHFPDPNLSLATLAEEWGYSANYLSDRFKKRMEMGFSLYLTNRRIRHGVFLLEHGVESVKNVAFLCGFRDPLYFSKVFRGQMGCSPKEYLHRLRADP
ncbi:MAG: helix-turn-helix transcriptional regulator [Clostridia bacterium]|nr:helix-turn-helix transcriptional regulator [Clostridia bacterium]